jgi:hypothetical protein
MTRAPSVMRQSLAGLLWSKQFYHYVVKDWIDGDSGQPQPPIDRQTGRNYRWRHLFNADVISMPDKCMHADAAARSAPAVVSRHPGRTPSRPRLHARRAGVPVIVRHSRDLAASPPAPLHSTGQRVRAPGRLRTGRIDHGFLRRQFELARSDLVSGELSAHRIATEVPPLPWSVLQGGMPHRVGSDDDARGGRRRAVAPLVADLSAGRRRPAGRCSETSNASSAIHTGATTCRSTNTFMATAVAASARATRPDGPA